jgi:hypothetical protein
MGQRSKEIPMGFTQKSTFSVPTFSVKLTAPALVSPFMTSGKAPDHRGAGLSVRGGCQS